ncbi:Pentatricopeptide repeat-containing protein [Acorus gramineus]|uniref:Pentatricopeptide repeat-containing protein n=1 Tax=Acorus gramineus TaxID=55184 RepID=A0AAV9BLT9_ACOGR|nr:Pentatricopeptide repeat-containing protein [Acorus gramineus]
MEAIQSHSLLSFSSNLCKGKVRGNPYVAKIKFNRKMEVVAFGMLAPRKFMQRRKKVEVFKDAADEADQKTWRRLMNEIDESGSAVSVLRNHRIKGQALPRDLVLGTLVRFKQLKRWNIVSEILEWLRCQHWWDFSEMDFLMLITAYGKLGQFNKAERIMTHINKKGYTPSVISHTALMEAYGRAGQYNKAEAIFRRMQSSGPEPSALTYQIILKSFVQGDKYKEAEEIFQSLLSNEKAPFKPDQKMFHMMIYMHKKAGSYDQARKIFTQMADHGVPQSTVTFNSLMSFETNYKEVSKIYDQMQKAGLRPDVVSYALLISAYGKARREEEALAVFEEMLDAGVRPSRKSYNILLDAFAISGMVEEARTVFKSMRRDKCNPDLCSYATMLSAYVNASDMEGAEKFFRRIKQDGFEPNVVIYGTLMKGYAKANDLEKMMGVYEAMRMQGVEANQTILTTIMDAHGKNSDFESAIIWFKEMESRGFPPDQKAKNVLLSLAKTPEERMEANAIVGNVVVGTTEGNVEQSTLSVGNADICGDREEEDQSMRYESVNEDEDDDDDDENYDDQEDLGSLEELELMV